MIHEEKGFVLARNKILTRIHESFFPAFTIFQLRRPQKGEALVLGYAKASDKCSFAPPFFKRGDWR